MFFGKRQPVQYGAPSMMATTMPDGEMMHGMSGMQGMSEMSSTSGMAMTGHAGMVGMPYGPEVTGYAGPGHFLHGTPGMPGCDLSGYAVPGTTEAFRACPTEYEMPYCPPMSYEYSETDLEIESRPIRHVHIVRKGETVYKIAKHFGLDWRELAGYNHLGNPNLIYPGQRLEIPPRY